MTELTVLVYDQPIGQIRQGRSGRYAFAYTAEWLANPTAVPLSLSMPLANAEHEDDAIRPFLWGLLPDSDATLGAWANR